MPDRSAILGVLLALLVAALPLYAQQAPAAAPAPPAAAVAPAPPAPPAAARPPLQLIDTPAKAKAAQEEWAKKLNKPVQYSNSIGMKFQLIPPGRFTMGSSDGDADAPQHLVTITEPFYLGATEVTRQQWETVTKLIHSTFYPGPDMPMNCIAPGREMNRFINALNKQENLLDEKVADPKAQKRTYRMPTEAQWEYAARAGVTGNYPGGNKEEDLQKVAWYVANSEDTTHPVGQKEPNAFGLHDMLGNVWEWCSDLYEPGYYQVAPQEDPQGPERYLYHLRVLRGGSIHHTAKACRFSNRAFFQDSRYTHAMGFRLVLPIVSDAAENK